MKTHRIIVLTLSFFVLYANFSYVNAQNILSDDDTVMKIATDIQKFTHQTAMQKKQEGKEVESASAFILISKEAHEKAFKANGYNFSKTLDLITSERFDKNSLLIKQIIMPFLFRTLYSIDNSTPHSSSLEASLAEIYGETDAKNILKIQLAMSVKNPMLNSPDYNAFTLKEIDSLIRKKWAFMRQALVSGNTEEALQYFVTKKRGAYREIFSKSPKVVKHLTSIKQLEIVESESNTGTVKYLSDVVTLVGGEKRTLSSYIIFKRDVEDGLWKVEFF